MPPRIFKTSIDILPSKNQGLREYCSHVKLLFLSVVSYFRLFLLSVCVCVCVYTTYMKRSLNISLKSYIIFWFLLTAFA